MHGRPAAGFRLTRKQAVFECRVGAADMDYPQRVAFVFLSKLMEEFGIAIELSVACFVGYGTCTVVFGHENAPRMQDDHMIIKRH